VIRRARSGGLAATALLVATLLIAACGSTSRTPDLDPTTPGSFDSAYFDASTWR